jgi:NAD(P)-dependent dehydrogenase (short-subunit alcohol dehydrogenase family)
MAGGLFGCAGVEGFARGAALEIVRSICVNVVSPGWIA